jgi:hypothetical protein
MKLCFSTAAVLLISSALPALAASPPPGVVDLLKGLEGKDTWLRIDVIRVQYPLNGKDATNVLPDGHVRYRLLMGFRSTESTATEEFTKDVERHLQQHHQEGQVRVLGKGSPVKIAKVESSDDEVQLEIRDSGNSKNKIRFKYDKDKQSFTVDNVKHLLEVCFADSEAEAKGDQPTATIKLGMSLQEVTAIKGAPKTTVDMGSKVIATYPDLKLTFQDGKLADVQ